MKTLIIVIHPNLENSVVNRKWIEKLSKHPEKYTLHNLHGVYPNGRIDVAKEQQLLANHDKIVFQFPFYWFNCPPFFKQWLDEVLTYGWAYGKHSGFKLKGKKIALAISVGINEAEYRLSGRRKYTLKQLTAPFKLTFDYVKADYQSLFAFYGIEHHGSTERIEKSAADYVEFLERLG